MTLQRLFAPDITRLTTAKTEQASSSDRSGRNSDWISVAPGERCTLAEVDAPGCITHFCYTMINPDILDFRETILLMFWDGVNPDVPGNYVILEPEGRGHLAGVLLNVDNVAG